VKPYSEKTLRHIIGLVKERMEMDPRTRGMDFSLKTYRATYCQMLLDLDPSLLPDVSTSMGHSSTQTTEAFYGRVKQGKALGRIKDAWSRRNLESPEKGLIESKFEMTGYV
jgi:integrase